MSLAKIFAGTVNMTPETQRTEFVSIFDAGARTLERYKRKLIASTTE